MNLKKTVAALLAVLMVGAAAAGCGKTKKPILVAEKESAGERVAQNEESLKGYEYVAVQDQASALMEVKAGTADAAIIDYVMTIGSIGEGTDYADLTVEGDGYAPESYGIAFRKGSDAAAKVNEAIKKLVADGTVKTIAEKYKLQDLITATDPTDPFVQSETDSDWAYIQEKGKLVVGITYFAPMCYMENGELTGFETEFIKAVCKEIGVEPVFQEISWDGKLLELQGKNIDCIWNGMTITDEIKENTTVSVAYMNNKQVKVVKK